LATEFSEPALVPKAFADLSEFHCHQIVLSFGFAPYGVMQGIDPIVDPPSLPEDNANDR